jgi:hypothetical protein
MQRNAVQMNEFVAAAERTISLNEHGLMCGVKLINHGSATGYAAASKRLIKNARIAEGLKVLAQGNKSDVHPSGKPVDKITADVSCKRMFFHVPGVATVGGVALDPEAIVKRPTNVLVFGLIKQSDAMKATADVAEKMLAEPSLATSRVIVVSKMFKNFQHSAFATLAGKMCWMTNKEIITLQGIFEHLGNTTQHDEASYPASHEVINTERKKCSIEWQMQLATTCGLAHDLVPLQNEVVLWDLQPYASSPIADGVIDVQRRLNNRDLCANVGYDRNLVTFKQKLRWLQTVSRRHGRATAATQRRALHPPYAG